MRPDPDNQEAGPEVTVGVRPARLATTNITNWKLEQQKDPVLYQVVKHRKASRETFKEALSKVTDRKAVSAYVKSKDQLVMKNGLLYQQSKQGQTQETVLQIHRNAALEWVPSGGSPSRPEPIPISHARMLLVAWHGSRPQEPHQEMQSLQEV